MAENKKSFVLYCDLISNIDHLTNEEKGLLFNHLLEYVNDKNPVLTDRVLISVWKPIQRQLKRDLEKYEEKRDKKSISGREGNLKRWHIDLYNEYKKGIYTLKSAENIAVNRTTSHNDSSQSQNIANIAVNDNVSVNEIIDKSITIEDLPIFETPKPIENELTEQLFLKRWCDARTHYDKMPTNITKLTTYEKIDFNELKRDYKLIDFEQAMQGLFQQKTFPKTRLRPTHFLKRENFEPYLTCFTTKEKLFSDNKYKKPIEKL